VSNLGWFIVGVITYADIVLLAMALCRAAKNGDRQLGYEQ